MGPEDKTSAGDSRAKTPEPVTDSPETMAVNEMFNDWRDSDSELPFWAWTARRRR